MTKKINILNIIYWNNNHCGRDSIKDFIKRDKQYWYGFFSDIMIYIKECPFFYNSKSKFKKINTGIKISLIKVLIIAIMPIFGIYKKNQFKIWM